jgi:hypothetical protein
VEDKNTHGRDHDRRFCSIHIITHNNVIAIYLKPGRRATPSCTTAPSRQHPEADEARRSDFLGYSTWQWQSLTIKNRLPGLRRRHRLHPQPSLRHTSRHAVRGSGPMRSDALVFPGHRGRHSRCTRPGRHPSLGQHHRLRFARPAVVTESRRTLRWSQRGGSASLPGPTLRRQTLRQRLASRDWEVHDAARVDVDSGPRF